MVKNNLIILCSLVVFIVGCSTSQHLIEPKLVTSRAPNVCSGSDKIIGAELVTWAGAQLIEKGVELAVDELTKTMKEEVEKHTNSYSFGYAFSCDFTNGEDKNINTQLVKNDKQLAEFNTKMQVVKNRPDLLTVIVGLDSINWNNFKVGPKEQLDAMVAVNLIWKTNTRVNGEFKTKELFNGTLGKFKVKDGKSATKSNSNNLSAHLSYPPVNHPPVIKSELSDQSFYIEQNFEQIHELTWMFTVVDDSLSAELKRKVYDALEKNKDRTQEDLIEYLKQNSGLKS